jgi:8-oxo-dGTP pyrophosphatase MutT (NUDIX family)
VRHAPEPVHRPLVIVRATDHPELGAEIAEARREYTQYLSERGVPLHGTPEGLLIVQSEQHVVGVCLSLPEYPAISLFVRDAFRGRGIGDWVVEELALRGDDLLIHERCGAGSYFQERGYSVVAERSGFVQLRPPTRSGALRPAASVCLLEPTSGQVLIGRRLTPPWPGYWAFPGGKLEPGEPPLDGALRELAEETGISAPPRDIAFVTRVYAGSTEAIYVIDNFCILARERAAPHSLPEIDARWVTIADALTLRPMAAGTRRVLRRVAREWPDLAGWANGAPE